MSSAHPHSDRERRHVSLFQRGHAWVIAALSSAHGKRLEKLRRELIAPLRGRVLEIGPGSGTNLGLYHRSVEWVGVEPSGAMRDALVRAATRAGRSIELLEVPAERLPLPDASVDAVVSTLVLCSVADQRAVLREIRRVLRPGGRFVFVEHVAARRGTLLRRLQRVVRLPWCVAGAGCHPDRETWGAIEEAGFRRREIRHFSVRVAIVSPHIAGWAEK